MGGYCDYALKMSYMPPRTLVDIWLAYFTARSIVLAMFEAQNIEEKTVKNLWYDNLHIWVLCAGIGIIVGALYLTITTPDLFE